MSLRLPTFQSGRPLLEQVTADKLNQLVDAIRQCELQSGVGYDVNKNSGGATLTIRQQGHQYVQGDGTKKLIGLSNSGMSHTDASVVVNPGVESYNFFCKTPTGSYTTAFVHGITFSNYATYNTANDYGKNITLVAKRSAVTFASSVISIASNDLYRRVGLEAPYTGDVEIATSNNVTTHASPCAAISSGDYIIFFNPGYGFNSGYFSVDCGSVAVGQGLAPSNTGSKYVATSFSNGFNCSGTTYIVSTSCTGRFALNYYTFGSPTDLAGCFRADNAAGETVPSGNYSYKRTFDLAGLSPASVRLRIKIRVGQAPIATGGVSTSVFQSVKLNGVNVNYSTFENQTSTYIPMEISDGFVSGSNDLEFIFNSANTNVLPTISFEFLPTAATIESSTGFAALTDAQKDLIGNGTPVQVTVGTTSSLYAYNGSGDKGTTAAYTFLRDV